MRLLHIHTLLKRLTGLFRAQYHQISGQIAHIKPSLLKRFRHLTASYLQNHWIIRSLWAASPLPFLRASSPLFTLVCVCLKHPETLQTLPLPGHWTAFCYSTSPCEPQCRNTLTSSTDIITGAIATSALFSGRMMLIGPRFHHLTGRYCM